MAPIEAPNIDTTPELSGEAQFRYTEVLKARNIRLLQIKPGQDDQIIEVNLCAYPLGCAPRYIALSYTWGDPKDTCRILCQNQTLSVTRNLKDALWQLRESHDLFAGQVFNGNKLPQILYYWIDAICINQNDNDEKSDQVRLMWEIYNGARLVIGWLGKQDEFTQSGLDLVRKISTVTEQRSRKQVSEDIRISELQIFDLPSLQSKEWDHLFSILSRSWFTRVWVIQEIIAAETFVFLCGSDVIDSSMLLKTGLIIHEDKLLASIRNFDRKRIPGANVASLSTLKLKGKRELVEILWSTHLFQASNPLDKVFALVHMAHDIVPDAISDLIDYKLDLREVLIKTANISLHKGFTDLLCYAQALGHVYSLPSWVPNWAAPDFSYFPLIQCWDGLPITPQTTTLEPYYRIEPNQTLVLEGKIFDKIEKIVEYPRRHVYDEWLADTAGGPHHRANLVQRVLPTKIEDTRAILEFHTKCIDQARSLFQYHTGQSIPDLYWRAYFMDNSAQLPLKFRELFEDHMGNMEAEISVLEQMSRLLQSDAGFSHNLVRILITVTAWSFSKVLCNFLPRLLNHLGRFALSVSTTLIVESMLKKARALGIIARQYRQSARFLNQNLETFTKAENRLSGRNFCVTENGYVGWVSHFAKKGDGICVFRGCRFPFAVRKIGSSDNGKYILRGDFYLHGLMSDDLFEKSRVDAETIRII